MKKHIVNITCAGLAFAIGLAVKYLDKMSARGDPPPAVVEFSEMPLAQKPLPALSASEGQIPADFFVYEDHLTHNGYTIQKRQRRALLEYLKEVQTHSDWLDVSYVEVRKGGKLQAKFDADIYFGLGNSANFGFFPFLGGNYSFHRMSQEEDVNG